MTSESTEDKKIYQLNFLISPQLDSSQSEDFLNEIKSLVSRFGEVLNEELPKRIRLSYPINKKKEAFFCFVEFQGKPEQIDELKKELEKEKNILRYLLTIKKDGIKKKSKEARRIKKKPAFSQSEIKEKEEETDKEKKVELKEIEKKLGKILDK